MYKIIKIENGKVFIGKADGSFIEVDASSLGFAPVVGDVVEFFQNGDQYIVSRVEQTQAQQAFGFSGSQAVTGSKNKLVAALLAFFLGTLGIHNFYLGHTGKGVAQLLLTTLGSLIFIGPFVTGIWALVEAVMILISKPGTSWHQDADGLELQD